MSVHVYGEAMVSVNVSVHVYVYVTGAIAGKMD